MNSDELFLRYTLGTASRDEVDELEQRLRNDESLQDEFIRYTELDALLHQEAQSVRPEEELSKVNLKSNHSSLNLWKWVSGISTLAAMILLVALATQFPPTSPAMAYPSLGKTSFDVPLSGSDIWSAAGRGDLETLLRGLETGTSVDARTPERLTALHIAAITDQPQIAARLLVEGADVSLTGNKGNTALHMAAFLGNTQVVQTLLAHRANPSIRNGLGFNATDLVAVAWSSDLESYYRQLETELEIEIDLEKVKLQRPIILKLLVAADNSELDNAPSVSIFQASITGNTSAIEQHIAAGTDLNQREDFGGSTPLILAAIFDKPDVVKALIDAGADMELQNKSGGSALHQACFYSRPKVVKLLLDSRARPNDLSRQGSAPLDIVTDDFDSELQAVYKHFYNSLNIDFDVEDIQRRRQQIAEMLRIHQSQNPSE